jgi:predicted amino acid-binding ACT domain protein
MASLRTRNVALTCVGMSTGIITMLTLLILEHACQVCSVEQRVFICNTFTMKA